MTNVLVLTGRIGNDPNFKEDGDKLYCSFRLATNEYRGGEKKTTWHSVKCFDTKLSQVIRDYATKGTLVSITGSMQYREYEKRDMPGVKLTAAECILAPFKSQFELLADARPKQDNQSSQQSAPEDEPW